MGYFYFVLSTFLIWNGLFFDKTADENPFPFARPSKIGQKFEFQIQTEKKIETHLLSQQQNSPKKSKQISQTLLNMNGIMEILEVNSFKNAKKIKIKLTKWSFLYNGKEQKIECPPFEIIADLSLSPVLFSSLHNQTISPEQQVLLAMIFRPSNNSTLNDLFGPDRFQYQLPWTPSKQAVIEGIQSLKLPINESQISAIAWGEEENVNSISGVRFHLNMGTLEDFEKEKKDYPIFYKFYLNVFLPQNVNLPALQIHKTCEFSEKWTLPVNSLIPEPSDFFQTTLEDLKIQLKVLDEIK